MSCTCCGLHHFHSKQKAQDKLDNLAAKPFFLEIISSSSLLSHPSRERMLRATLVPFPADNTYILSLSRSLPTLVVPTPCFSLLPLFLAPSFARLRISLSGIPKVWNDRQRGPRGWRLPNGWNAGTYICSFGPSWARNRYLRNVKCLAT